MMPITPVSPNLEIEIDVSNSCNDCCSCWPKKTKQVTPSGTKAQQKEIIDQKIKDFQKLYHESYIKPHQDKRRSEEKM